MCNLHQFVVDNIGEVIGGKPVPLANDEVVLDLGFLVASVDNILHHHWLLVDTNRRKLSKRDSGVDMSWYMDRHILPETLLNFAVLLGWGKPSSFKGDVMTLQEMVDNVSPFSSHLSYHTNLTPHHSSPPNSAKAT